MSACCGISSLFFPVHQILLHPAPFVLIKQSSHEEQHQVVDSLWQMENRCLVQGDGSDRAAPGAMPRLQVALGMLATMVYPSWGLESHRCWRGAAASPETLPGHQWLLWSQGFFPTTSPGLDRKQNECLTTYALKDMVFNLPQVLYK